MNYSKPIQNLIRAFARLPSVGERTAERFVFHILKSGRQEAAGLQFALGHLLKDVISCSVCFDFSDKTPCGICSDKTRDREIICVVAESQDLRAMERTGVYKGLYHVLRGTLPPDAEEESSILKIGELLARVTHEKPAEIILALNHDLSGETTAMYIKQKLKAVFPDLAVSRLARGLPMGSDLRYADDITLGSAIKHRTN